jgi:hypothetical protein
VTLVKYEAQPTASVKDRVHSHISRIFVEKHNRVYMIINIAIVRQGPFSSGTSRGVGWQLQIYDAQKKEDINTAEEA